MYLDFLYFWFLVFCLLLLFVFLSFHLFDFFERPLPMIDERKNSKKSCLIFNDISSLFPSLSFLGVVSASVISSCKLLKGSPVSKCLKCRQTSIVIESTSRSWIGTEHFLFFHFLSFQFDISCLHKILDGPGSLAAVLRRRSRLGETFKFPRIESPQHY